MPRLDRILRDRGLSASQARDALRWGKVFLDGIPTSLGGREIRRPERVEHRPEATRLQPGRDVAFVHVDEHLAVVWKPAGLLAVPAPRRDGHQSVLGEVGRKLGRVLPVHRLDEPTSGLMMVARTAPAQLALKDLLEAHDVERRYLALVKGRLPEDEMRVETIFIRDRGDGLRGSAHQGTDPLDGRRAVTNLVHLDTFERGVTLVGATLETGRTHQVRIHLAELGCPVLGDPLYAKRHITGMAPRLALHAAALGFTHPMTGDELRFRAPLADDLVSVIGGLREPEERPRGRGRAPRRDPRRRKK